MYVALSIFGSTFTMDQVEGRLSCEERVLKISRKNMSIPRYTKLRKSANEKASRFGSA